MDRLRGIDALVFVLDPDKPGVRYEVTRQVFWSYPLFARSKGEKELGFVAEGPEAEEACAALMRLLETPHAELCAAGDFDPLARGGPAQIPHPTEPVPPWPNFGLLRPLHEIARWGVLRGDLDSMNNKPPGRLGRLLLAAARREAA